MGSINYIFPKENWRILLDGNLATNGKKIYKIKIGESDMYYSTGEISVFMLKEVYDKIMDEEYTVIQQPYSETPIRVLDKNKNEVKLY